MNIQQGNVLLEQLPQDELEHLRPYLQLVSLEKNQVVYEQDAPVTFFYFPLTAVVMFSVLTDDGVLTDVAFVDCGSMFPLSAVADTHCLLGVHVLMPGLAYRLPVEVFRQEFSQGQAFAKLVMRAVRNLLAQLSLGSVCFRRHSTRQILAKLLLIALQQRSQTDLDTTHRQLADIVGVRREAITLTLRQFEDKGVLHCTRRKIHLMNRPALEAMACSCYGMRTRLSMFQHLLV